VSGKGGENKKTNKKKWNGPSERGGRSGGAPTLRRFCGKKRRVGRGERGGNKSILVGEGKPLKRKRGEGDQVWRRQEVKTRGDQQHTTGMREEGKKGSSKGDRRPGSKKQLQGLKRD